MFARTPCRAWGHGFGVQNSSFFPPTYAPIWRPCWNSLHVPATGAWLLILPHFPTPFCPCRAHAQIGRGLLNPSLSPPFYAHVWRYVARTHLLTRSLAESLTYTFQALMRPHVRAINTIAFTTTFRKTKAQVARFKHDRTLPAVAFTILYSKVRSTEPPTFK